MHRVSKLRSALTAAAWFVIVGTALWFAVTQLPDLVADAVFRFTTPADSTLVTIDGVDGVLAAEHTAKRIVARLESYGLRDVSMQTRPEGRRALLWRGDAEHARVLQLAVKPGVFSLHRNASRADYLAMLAAVRSLGTGSPSLRRRSVQVLRTAADDVRDRPGAEGIDRLFYIILDNRPGLLDANSYLVQTSAVPLVDSLMNTAFLRAAISPHLRHTWVKGALQVQRGTELFLYKELLLVDRKSLLGADAAASAAASVKADGKTARININLAPTALAAWQRAVRGDAHRFTVALDGETLATIVAGGRESPTDISIGIADPAEARIIASILSGGELKAPVRILPSGLEITIPK